MEIIRPAIPPRFTTTRADEAAKLITEFKAWFAREEFHQAVQVSTKRTREYLMDYDHTPTPQGGIGDANPWVKLEGVPLPQLPPTDDPVLKDLRLSGLRLKTWSEGVCRMIGILSEADALPKFANSYNDASTNLAEWFLHEQLMRAHLKTKEAKQDPTKIGVIKLNDLLWVYMYDPRAQQEAVRAKVVQMVSVGLWDADPPVDAKEWKIRAGPVAVAFHLDVFFPVVEHFKKYL